MVLDWDTPFAEVYARDELLEAFPDAPLIHAGPPDEFGPGTLLVVVIDERGESAYSVPDPGVSNRSSPDARARRRTAGRALPPGDRWR